MNHEYEVICFYTSNLVNIAIQGKILHFGVTKHDHLSAPLTECWLQAELSLMRPGNKDHSERTFYYRVNYKGNNRTNERKITWNISEPLTLAIFTLRPFPSNFQDKMTLMNRLKLIKWTAIVFFSSWVLLHNKWIRVQHFEIPIKSLMHL